MASSHHAPSASGDEVVTHEEGPSSNKDPQFPQKIRCSSCTKFRNAVVIQSSTSVIMADCGPELEPRESPPSPPTKAKEEENRFVIIEEEKISAPTTASNSSMSTSSTSSSEDKDETPRSSASRSEDKGKIRPRVRRRKRRHYQGADGSPCLTVSDSQESLNLTLQSIQRRPPKLFKIQITPDSPQQNQQRYLHRLLLGEDDEEDDDDCFLYKGWVALPLNDYDKVKEAEAKGSSSERRKELRLKFLGGVKELFKKVLVAPLGSLLTCEGCCRRSRRRYRDDGGNDVIRFRRSLSGERLDLDCRSTSQKRIF